MQSAYIEMSDKIRNQWLDKQSGISKPYSPLTDDIVNCEYIVRGRKESKNVLQFDSLFDGDAKLINLITDYATRIQCKYSDNMAEIEFFKGKETFATVRTHWIDCSSRLVVLVSNNAFINNLATDLANSHFINRI